MMMFQDDLLVGDLSGKDAPGAGFIGVESTGASGVFVGIDGG
jgi:hypothetical protein